MNVTRNCCIGCGAQQQPQCNVRRTWRPSLQQSCSLWAAVCASSTVMHRSNAPRSGVGACRQHWTAAAAAAGCGRWRLWRRCDAVRGRLDRPARRSRLEGCPRTGAVRRTRTPPSCRAYSPRSRWWCVSLGPTCPSRTGRWWSRSSYRVDRRSRRLPRRPASAPSLWIRRCTARRENGRAVRDRRGLGVDLAAAAVLPHLAAECTYYTEQEKCW